MNEALLNIFELTWINPIKWQKTVQRRIFYSTQFESSDFCLNLSTNNLTNLSTSNNSIHALLVCGVFVPAPFFGGVVDPSLPSRGEFVSFPPVSLGREGLYFAPLARGVFGPFPPVHGVFGYSSPAFIGLEFAPLAHEVFGPPPKRGEFYFSHPARGGLDLARGGFYLARGGFDLARGGFHLALSARSRFDTYCFFCSRRFRSSSFCFSTINRKLSFFLWCVCISLPLGHSGNELSTWHFLTALRDRCGKNCAHN